MPSGIRWTEQNHAAWKLREAEREAECQVTGNPSLVLPIVGECNAQDRPRPKLKLTRPEAPEAAILDAVLRTLRIHPRVAWCERMNSGAGRFVYPDGSTSQFIRFGFVGMSDILGQLRCGRLLAVECKAARGKPTLEQVAFLNTVARNGGVAVVARSASDVVEALA